MKKNYLLLFCSLFVGLAMQAQVSYSGNTNTGFGGAIGNGSMTINDDGTTITCVFTKGGGTLNNTMVMYISNGNTGRNVINGDINDTFDPNRRAISNTGSGDLTFPVGFAATHAASINTGFGGLWSIPAAPTTVGSNELPFVTAVGNPAADTDASFTFTFDWSDIGLTNTDKFDFVITYGNPNDGGSNMFSADEAFGDGIGAGNPGFAAITFTDDRSYPNTWTGTTDNDWATATNWTEGVPTATHNVYIPVTANQPTASGAVTINKGTIKSGASLIAQDVFTGILTYERNLATNNWYLMGAPVAGETIEDIISNNDIDNTTGTGSNIGLAPFDNTQTAATDRWNYQTAASTGALVSGGGYSVKFNTAGNLAVTGTMEVSDVGVSITNGSGTGGNAFNLVGNPYTSFLAANSNADATNNLLTINTASLTEETLWFWNQATSSYDQINQASTSFHVAPAQGFFVRTNGTNTFNITEAMQSHQGTDTFQRTSNTRPEINLTVTNGTSTRDADIFYIDGKTTGFDNGFDSSIFSQDFEENNFSLYTNEVANGTGRKLGIQTLPNTGLDTMVIPVGIVANNGDQITFDATSVNLPTDLKVFIEDRKTNTVTRLDDASSNYTLTLDEDLNGIGRFYVHARSSSVLSTNNVILENVSVYATGKNTVRIAGLSQGTSTVKMFNLLGKQVVSKTFTSNGVYDVTLPELATGIYIVQVANENGKLNKKIILE